MRSELKRRVVGNLTKYTLAFLPQKTAAVVSGERSYLSKKTLFYASEYEDEFNNLMKTLSFLQSTSKTNKHHFFGNNIIVCTLGLKIRQ